MKKVIVGLGEILWDVFTDKSILGGAPANFAYHAGQLGEDSYIVSAIGKDDLGKSTLNALKTKNAQYLLQQIDYPTGTVSVKLNDSGIPSYIIHEEVAWDHIPFTPELKELAMRTDAVCFGTLAQRNEESRQTITQFLQHMPADSMKIFDINLRQHFYTKEIIHHSLTMATDLKINDEELPVVAQLFSMGNRSEAALCNGIREMYGLNFVILTKGTEGSYIFSSERTSYQPTKRVVVADTVGAGDSFTAAFASAYLSGCEVDKAHHFAVEISAYVCTQHGAMP